MNNDQASFGSWFDKFDERQQKEIEFAALYAREYHHGTDGHNGKMILARMAELLNDNERALQVLAETHERLLQSVKRNAVAKQALEQSPLNKLAEPGSANEA